MNDYFNKNKNLFILTPFKFTLCKLINQIIRSIELDISSKVKLFDIMRQFLYDYSSELSYHFFLNKLKKIAKREKTFIRIKRISEELVNKIDKENILDFEIINKESYDYVLELINDV